jgi:hypothetical protein
MSLLNDFDANSVPKSEAIPDGTQAVCLVVAATDHETKDASGAYLKLEVEVVDGPYKGRKVWPMFNLRNSNDEAVRIAKQQLAQLCLAIGCPKPQGNSDLMNKPFRATFGKPSDFNGEQQSRVKKYDPVGGSSAVTAGLGQPAGASQKPAWAK